MTDYYFWSLAHLTTKLPFICERPQKDIGCVSGNGESYTGTANRGESGDICLPWDSPEAGFVLNEDELVAIGVYDHGKDFNHCRNPDGDSSPWCLAPNGEFDYCDIPKCQGDAERPPNPRIVATTEATTNDLPNDENKCKSGLFQCSKDLQNLQCILPAYICDGHRDCYNGNDEKDCEFMTVDMNDLVKFEGKHLDLEPVEKWHHMTAVGCATRCAYTKDFICRSFSFHSAQQLCYISEENIGSSGKVVNSPTGT